MPPHFNPSKLVTISDWKEDHQFNYYVRIVQEKLQIHPRAPPPPQSQVCPQCEGLVINVERRKKLN